ncbi:DUF2167 domain-containing protein [Aquincola sp. S2]|uniref:DUF2167 domain-containing protein n=2 Tax=Pseudaquabacterium terrae TaxID=2732868 RepID=A0ABX2EC57_9BURK|nr:DUF2167 domain-containing protein [Aquabacterium terrae]NRF65952.1 DUF2167 domain-containing protein [Aquabacterium terrae]
MTTTLRASIGALILLLATAVHAAAPSAEDRARQAAEAQADARQAAKPGPTDIPLADQAVLHLPAGHVFIPQPQAGKLLNAMGNPGQDPRLHGLIFPSSEAQWFMTVRYEASGHVKDDDARDWNADDLLKSYREGTEAANEERQKMGVTPMEIIGWAEKPAYDAGTHRLVWAMSSRDKGAPADAPQGVNFNTYALGREGYFSLNLVTDLKDLAAHKPAAQALLGALEFNAGRRYADFNEKTDHVAEYGLAALVVGVAAKKLGFFALALAFIAKFAKVFLIGAALVGGAVFKFLRRSGSAGRLSPPRGAAAEPPGGQ